MSRMFWRFGNYGQVSTIDTLLEKDNLQLEELLDESDLVQELKQHNAKLVEYVRNQKILERLLEYVVAPKLAPVAAPDDDDDDEEADDDDKGKDVALPFARSRASSKAAELGSEEETEKQRNRYAFVAAEVLSSDNWSLCEALMESRSLLRNFWQFLKRPVPLDPLQASYFTKVNESLFDKKTEDMLDLLKSLDGAIPDILKHVDCPMIMDLLLRIISLERTESGQGIVEWLYTQDVIPTLLSFLGPEHSWATQTSAGDFLKAIITVSANASQNEQTCIGPNELTRQLVSRPCVEQMIKYMLGGGNPLTCGVGIVIEVIRKNNSDYDPDSVESGSVPSSRDPIYLGTLLRLFAEHVPDFMNLIMNAPAQKERLESTFGDKIEPLGFDRFKTCELMAELLHCSNMGLLNEVGSEEFIASRDVQRQRLRQEGRLLPARGEDIPSSVEDLHMRASHSSPEVISRKLEIMNSSADDDGFEEVTHAADEDSSGVEELPEVPMPGPTSSFLDKDEDDFVDEPLSSPRLNVREIDEKDGPQFDDQDLLVRPLSPTKQPAPVSPEKQKDSDLEKVAEADLSLEDLSLEEKKPLDDAKVQPAPLESETKSESSSQTTTPLLTPTTSEAEPQPAEKLSVEPEKALSISEEMSPHPEDTPAPLFSTKRDSATLAPESFAAPEVPEAPDAPLAAAPGEIHAPDELPIQILPVEPESRPEEADVSIVVGRMSEPTTPIDDTSPITSRPVVGDYLKMQFVENRVVPTILGFFFSYPWNNFLHNVVYDIVQQVFNGPMDRGYNPTLAISLFESADITNQIINGQLASERSQTVNKTRMGYMGHLTLIAEEVVKFTERHPPEILSEIVLEKVMAQDWINYVEGALAETRERDNAILGGVRPDVAHANRAGQNLGGVGLSGLGAIGLGGSGASSVLAEAGLNGGQDVSENNGGGGIGPFAISAGTLMSGFGSSSDEDEDEEQDNEEDINNEFRAYTDPLNANHANSMNPPSIPPPPPPPPPLNIPPSRARLQLAARLAMNKRNAAAAAAANGGQEGDSSSGDATSSLGQNAPPSERLRNPFADDEDDDDEAGSGSGSGSDDGDGENLGDQGVGSSGWNRGSWWRGVVRSARRGGNRGRGGDKSSRHTEKFGDGRDDSDSDGADDDVEGDMEDEEFGDFAMPEVEGKARDGSGPGALISGIDPAREKILVKPLPVHPNSVKNSGPFGSLWPFSTQAFGVKKEEGAGSSTDKAGENGVAGEKAGESGRLEDSEEVVGEDGHRIDRAVEAKSRTSIEDEDDVVVGEEIIVGKPSIN